jgi:hypothetical protein
MFAPDDYFVDPLPYLLDSETTIVRAGVTNVNADYGEQAPTISLFPTSTNDALFFYTRTSHSRQGDNVIHKFYRPDGTVASQFGGPIAQNGNLKRQF